MIPSSDSSDSRMLDTGDIAPTAQTPATARRVRSAPVIAASIVRRWRLILILPAILGVVVLVTLLLIPRTYSTQVSFLPQASSGTQLRGIAAQFGLDAGGTSTESPDFYIELLRTPELLKRIVTSQFSDTTIAGARVGSLVELYRINGADPAVNEEMAVRTLIAHLDAKADRRSGIVGLTVKERSATLSAQIASRLLDEINLFNRETRQSRARAERIFVEARLAKAKSELREAEDTMGEFLSGNRSLNSPQLAFKRDRLQREVQQRTLVYSSLSSSYEQSRIDEVRDTPSVTILQRAAKPSLPDPRGAVVKTLLAMIFGGILAILFVYLRDEWVAFAETGTAGAQELRTALRDVNGAILRRRA